MNIPARLKGLRQDRGRPVPYVNRWGPEDAGRIRIAIDPHVSGMPALFDDDGDEQAPDFTAQNFQRQRECMTQGLCQVCGRSVPWSRRFAVLSVMSTDRIDVHGYGSCVALTEPWLDEECARFALDVCPALIRRRRDESLILVRVERSHVRMSVSLGYVDGPLEQESKAVMPAMWAKAILLPRPGPVVRLGRSAETLSAGTVRSVT